jgi:hypothetical protein
VNVRYVPAALALVAIPILASQLLPANDTGQRSPAVPLALMLAAGGIAGWAMASARGWMVMATVVVLGAALVLLSWTDALLDVAPSVIPVDTWRASAFTSIVGALGVASAGYVAGALVRRRGAVGRVGRGTAAAIGLVLAVAVVSAGAVSTTFARSGIVLQDDALVTVVVTDSGIEVTPATVSGGADYRTVYESRASVPLVVAWVIPLSAGEGVPTALTADEVETWTSGAWSALAPPFQSAVTALAIEPGQRLYGGQLRLQPSADATGGTLWYTSEEGAVRPWPPGAEDGPLEPVPWPIRDHVVVPVAIE